ncbi:MAG TPA: DUF4244 domain-containing protein [Propionibacteriaceae bacterium]|nr:DUF4244 domain-containing protein [Propionibacteriaceae bacterium]HPZ49186.1 DUF4244 domain-containing protein [Propionibacteriaceae bacterium]HQE32360.1 DUF4244 domain-containing protein [Propionibacteriaceae bacterium]
MSQLSLHRQSLLARLARRSERGMTTAEYAVGTVAVVLFGGVLAKVMSDDEIARIIGQIILAIVRFILQLLGVSF